MDVQFFYGKDSLQVDAVFRGCKTSSTKWKDPTTYVEVNVKDPGFAVTRDHKVVLDDDGSVIDTESSLNPVQPTPTPNPNKDLIAKLKTAWPTLTADQKQALMRKALRRLLGE